MVLKWIKIGALAAAAGCLAGGALFGGDLVSYVRSSARSVRTAVKDAVPIDFELRRARDLLEDIIPEMQANIRLIAQEEVEVAALKADIQQCQRSLEDDRRRISKVRDLLAVQQVRYELGGRQYTREQLREDLAGRFDRHREAELVLAGKDRLLAARDRSLHAAMQMLERTRSRKAQLEGQIEGLESQFRLVKAASVGSHIQVDNSKLAQTEKLISQIKKRLDVAERVLAHETRFVEAIPVDTIDEKELLAQVDEYLAEDGNRVAAQSQAPPSLCQADRGK